MNKLNNDNGNEEDETPDQDQVDSISEPWGTNYKSEEDLNIEKKIRELEQSRENDEEEIQKG